MNGIYVGPDCSPVTQVEKYPKGRAIAAAYWISYFTLHWLLILEVIESTTVQQVTMVYFFFLAIVATMATIAFEETSKEKKK